MAGLIKDEDIQLVRERARIDEVIEQYVTLAIAGGGSLKGLCPVPRREVAVVQRPAAQGSTTASAAVSAATPSSSCMRSRASRFAEAVERLADKSGIQLRYEEGGSTPARVATAASGSACSRRTSCAPGFYADAAARRPRPAPAAISSRNAASTSPPPSSSAWASRRVSGEALVAHLKGKGFADEDLLVGGLAPRGQRGLYDRFRGRLLWPIREISGEIIGFGARRLFDDDRVEAKYLNTSETPIYKKSQVLYGIDLARRQIARSSQAVVVEGYTDVMACHLAGVPTAVATCGTAFGEDHARVLRRLLLDHDAFHGEVIFTFDGDEAGQTRGGQGVRAATSSSSPRPMSPSSRAAWTRATCAWPTATPPSAS